MPGAAGSRRRGGSKQAALMQVAVFWGGFRAARALCRRTELLLWEGATAQAQALFAETLRHPACEAHIRERAAAALNPLGSSPGRP